MGRETSDDRHDRLRRAGRWLHQQREDAGLTQVELSERLPDVSQHMVSAFERGAYEVDAGVARDMAAVFGVSEWEVWRGLEMPLPRELDDDEAIQRALGLMPDVMAKVPEIVEKVTGAKPKRPPPVAKDVPSKRSRGTRSGDRRRNPDTGAESAV